MAASPEYWFARLEHPRGFMRRLPFVKRMFSWGAIVLWPISDEGRFVRKIQRGLGLFGIAAFLLSAIAVNPIYFIVAVVLLFPIQTALQILISRKTDKWRTAESYEKGLMDAPRDGRPRQPLTEFGDTP